MSNLYSVYGSIDLTEEVHFLGSDVSPRVLRVNKKGDEDLVKEFRICNVVLNHEHWSCIIYSKKTDTNNSMTAKVHSS